MDVIEADINAIDRAIQGFEAGLSKAREAYTSSDIESKQIRNAATGSLITEFMSAMSAIPGLERLKNTDDARMIPVDCEMESLLIEDSELEE